MDKIERDSLVSGVLFDFMGWLTTRKDVLCLGSEQECSPAANVIEEFCKMRNVSMSDANVENWENMLTSDMVDDINERDSKLKFGSIV